MRRSLKFRNYKTTKLQNPQRGYMLITLMLAVALMSIAMLAVLPRIRQQIQRDRELELQHRGTAYMRAIQHFYKKFGRYPSRVEELENTNNMRFLRKRYTDPVNIDPATGKERPFKFLTQLDISLNNGPVLGLNPGQNGQTPGTQSPFGSSPTAGGRPTGGLSSGSAGSTNSDNSESDTSATVTPNGGHAATGSEDAEDADTKVSPLSSSPSSGSGLNGQTFGGGPIIGVASTNKKDKTIHVFYTKDHYNDWYFIYVQALERG